MIGTTLSHYKILELLGRGGMGEVYLAEDTRLRRKVALKALPAELASDPERLSRIQREAETVAALNHPNIVTLYSLEEADGVRFLTMEYAEGKSLDQVLSSDGLSIEKVIQIAVSLAEALAAAHEKGIIHRDLKPANIILTSNNRIKVLDFGLAKVTGEAVGVGDSIRDSRMETTPITDENMVAGTIPYMAPEQLRSGIADERSDLYSLGVVLYELLAGERPFQGLSSPDLMSSILRDEPIPITDRKPGVPEGVVKITHRLLKKEPGERFQSATELAAALMQIGSDPRSLAEDLDTKPAAPMAVTGTIAPSATPTIAVLPIADMSPGRDQEHFTDGLTEELLNMLSKVKGFRVVGRTSSFQFKGKNVDIREIGKKLNVDAVLEGSMRMAGDRIRITAQLVNTNDGYHIWSESYNRKLDDIFEVQDDIANSVVEALKGELLGESDVVPKASAVNPQALNFFLLARFHTQGATEQNFRTAADYLHEAIELEPQYAKAWAALSYVNSHLAGWIDVDARVYFSKAREAALKSIVLDPDLMDGHLALAQTQFFNDFDWEAAKASVDKAMELEPNNPEAMAEAGRIYGNLDEVDKALGFIERSIEIDPLNATTYFFYGMTLARAGRMEDADRALRRAVELSPTHPVALTALAITQMYLGRPEEGVPYIDRIDTDLFRNFTKAIVYPKVGRKQEAEEALATIIQKNADTAAIQITGVYSEWGDLDSAFEWLDRAYENHDSGLVHLKVESTLANMRRDPRFEGYLKKMNMA